MRASKKPKKPPLTPSVVQAPVSSKPAPEPELEETKLAPDGIDWDWVMAELMVEDQVPDLDPRLVRITIVHGLLRQGDRMSSMDRLPTRSRRRFWKECRGAGVNRSKLEAVRDQLKTRGLIKLKAGKYSLASQLSVADELHILHDRIRELSERYV